MSENCSGKCKSLEVKVDFDFLDQLISEQHQGSQENLIMILQGVQKKYNYLPEDALRHVADKLDMPLTQIYTVATFYASFSLTPKGKHIIQICTGTACHLNGGEKVVNELSEKLNVKAGETTDDGNFTLETVNCVGACALAMVAVVDEKYYPKTDAKEISKVIDQISEA